MNMMQLMQNNNIVYEIGYINRSINKFLNMLPINIKKKLPDEIWYNINNMIYAPIIAYYNEDNNNYDDILLVDDDGDILYKFDMHDESVNELVTKRQNLTVLQFSDNSTILFINNHDNFYFYNTLNGQLVSKFKYRTNSHSHSISFDNSKVVIVNNSTISVFDINNGIKLFSYIHCRLNEMYVTNTMFSSDSKMIISCGLINHTEIHSSSNGELLYTLNTGGCYQITISLNNKYLIFNNTGFDSDIDDAYYEPTTFEINKYNKNEFYIFDIEKNEKIQTITGSISSFIKNNSLNINF
jgi:hypothetical protein